MPASSARWFDSHCHLQDAEDLPEALLRADEAGVSGFVCIGTDALTSSQAIEIARSHANQQVFATIGLHPHEASKGTAEVSELLSRAVRVAVSHRAGEVVAVGECGLDYYYEHSPREAQRQAFIEQIAFAKLYDLALVIHTRDAWADTFAILDAEGAPNRTIIHCFTGGPDEARRCLDFGAYLSFSGIVTFKKAADVQAAARICPTERLLVETDAPYLAPVPYRGRPNEPAFVSLVGQAVAELRSVPADELAEAAFDNALDVFALTV